MDTVEAGWVGDQQLVAGRQDGVVDRVPGNPEPDGDPGDRHPVDDDTLHRLRRQFRPRRGGRGRVLTPDLPAARTAVAADADVQDRCPPAERDVRESAQHAVARHP